MHFSLYIYFVDVYTVYKERSSMKRTFVLALTPLIASCQVPTPELNRELTNVAQLMTSMNFDPKEAVTIHGHVGTLVWPEGTSGMVLIEADGKKYAFSTAKVPDMAKQGFTRFALRPGEEVTITGFLASGSPIVGPGFTAARADVIAKADGTHVFERAKLSSNGAK
jgi:hypothetical protein